MARPTRPVGRRTGSTLQDLDLAPILSILVLLIPVLLFAFQFFETTAQPVEAPRSGPPGTARQVVTVTVRIVPDGFDLSVAEPDAAPAHDPRIVRGAADYDYAALHNRLAELKARYPQTDAIGLSAAPDIPWQTIARTMDCARTRLAGAPFQGEDAAARYEAARPLPGKDDEVLLFPVVRFVVGS